MISLSRIQNLICKSGADLVMFHVEADTEEKINEAIDIVKACGKKVGLSVKPKTPAEALYPFLDRLDMVLDSHE